MDTTTRPERVNICVDFSPRLDLVTEKNDHSRMTSSGVAYILARLMEVGYMPTSKRLDVIHYEEFRRQANMLHKVDYVSPKESDMAAETLALLSEGLYTNFHELGLSDGHSCDLVIERLGDDRFELDIVPPVSTPA